MTLLKTERAQISELDRVCAELGLAAGEHRPGRKHGKYVVTLPNGREVSVSISKTPRCPEQAVTISRANLRIGIAKAMGWATS